MRVRFRETMQGRWSPTSDPHDERALCFTLEATSRSLASFVSRREVAITGTVDAEGLASGARLYGTLGLDVLRTGTLPYDFRFLGNDGRRKRFVGQKTVMLSRLADTMTTLPAVLQDDDGRELGTGEVRFDLRDLPSFLRSWTIVR